MPTTIPTSFPSIAVVTVVTVSVQTTLSGVTADSFTDEAKDDFKGALVDAMMSVSGIQIRKSWVVIKSVVDVARRSLLQGGVGLGENQSATSNAMSSRYHHRQLSSGVSVDYDINFVSESVCSSCATANDAADLVQDSLADNAVASTMTNTLSTTSTALASAAVTGTVSEVTDIIVTTPAPSAAPTEEPSMHPGVISAITAACLIAVGAAGGFYYYKVWKPAAEKKKMLEDMHDGDIEKARGMRNTREESYESESSSSSSSEDERASPVVSTSSSIVSPTAVSVSTRSSDRPMHMLFKDKSKGADDGDDGSGHVGSSTSMAQRKTLSLLSKRPSPVTSVFGAAENKSKTSNRPQMTMSSRVNQASPSKLTNSMKEFVAVNSEIDNLEKGLEAELKDEEEFLEGTAYNENSELETKHMQEYMARLQSAKTKDEAGAAGGGSDKGTKESQSIEEIDLEMAQETEELMEIAAIEKEIDDKAHLRLSLEDREQRAHSMLQELRQKETHLTMKDTEHADRHAELSERERQLELRLQELEHRELRMPSKEAEMMKKLQERERELEDRHRMLLQREHAMLLGGGTTTAEAITTSNTTTNYPIITKSTGSEEEQLSYGSIYDRVATDDRIQVMSNPLKVPSSSPSTSSVVTDMKTLPLSNTSMLGEVPTSTSSEYASTTDSAAADSTGQERFGAGSARSRIAAASAAKGGAVIGSHDFSKFANASQGKRRWDMAINSAKLAGSNKNSLLGRATSRKPGMGPGSMAERERLASNKTHSSGGWLSHVNDNERDEEHRDNLLAKLRSSKEKASDKRVQAMNSVLGQLSPDGSPRGGGGGAADDGSGLSSEDMRKLTYSSTSKARMKPTVSEYTADARASTVKTAKIGAPMARFAKK
jgi:hypothetical protein